MPAQEEARVKDCKAEQCDIILWVVCCQTYYTVTSREHATTSVVCTGRHACKAGLQTKHNKNAPKPQAAYYSDGYGMQACKARQSKPRGLRT